jgi:hypothetical protein
MATLPRSSIQNPCARSGTVLCILALFILGLFSFGVAPAASQSINRGTVYLTGSQAVDGRWESLQVLPMTATTEALRALQVLGEAPLSRSAAVTRLEAEPIDDTYDRARRILVLGAEGRNVSALVDQLRADADPLGGWGLLPGFSADTLDTSVALAAVAPGTSLGDAVLVSALSALLKLQGSDGGWPCVEGGDSDIYCTAYAVLGLAPYRSRFFLDPQVNSGAAFLKARLNASGSFGPTDGAEVLNTATAGLALAAVPAVSIEIGRIRTFLEGKQAPDGSWDGDAYTTAVVLQALDALSKVPYCGDGLVNLAEACDGADVKGATCGGLGLGTGTVSCTSACTLDTNACSGPPRCGDGIRNLANEACDGPDIGGGTCEGLGLGAGTLSCDSSCKFNTASCSAPPRCGDGVINRAGEACDGADLGGLTCADSGFLGGRLSCNADCTLNASSCTGRPFCGDGEINQSTEECDKLNFGSKTCDSLGLGGGTLTCSSACKLQTAGCATSGDVHPSSIKLGAASPICSGQAETVPVSLDFPDGSVIDKVDVFLLFDDTGSFARQVPTVSQIFNQLVGQLQTALPGVSFGFGVGRFEDFGGPGTSHSGDYLEARPFTLNQPIITPEVPNFLNLINSALSREAPGYGGDGPETSIEALFQVATGAGFDGNGNSSRLDSGLAGAPLTQVFPGISGDVPPFSSNVAPASGTLGGVGFRPGALRLVIQAGDICSVAPFKFGQPIPSAITGAGGATVPMSALRCSDTIGWEDRYGHIGDTLSWYTDSYDTSVAPRGSATVLDAIAALNSMGISVIGLAPGGVAIRNPIGPSYSPSVFLSAVALLTGATDATGNPLVFNMSGGPGPIRDAIVRAVTTVATRPRDVTLVFSGVPEGLNVTFTPPVVPGVGPGGTAAFNVTFKGNGSIVNGTFNLDFVDQLSNAHLATIPVSVGCLPVPPVPADKDHDGFPEGVDCNDNNPAVNPGAKEIPGNGIDDDCNVATPDVTPLDSAACRLFVDKLTYAATDVATLSSRVTNLTEELSLTGLTATLEIRPSAGGSPVSTQSRVLSTLPPGGLQEGTFTFSATGKPAGEYLGLLTVESGAEPVAVCSSAFKIESSALTGAGLRGTLVLNPAVVNAGSRSNATYTVTNQGNATLADLQLKVLLVDPDSGQTIGEILDGTTLAQGATYSATHPFATKGLKQKTYLAVLIATLAGSNQEQTLARATLKVVNEPPNCSQAVATPATVLWEPDHKYVPISITGVTDPDGDPVKTTIAFVLQDEPANDIGDGATCPDASGTGTSQVRIRAERSGKRDGRVYHVRFQAEDGRGGTCTGEVTVCVPHDNKPGATCVDEGPLFDSTVCQ